MEQLYSVVEFEDGLQMIPTSWLIKNDTGARWPPFTSHTRLMKAVQKCILPEDNWLIYNVKRILATANTYEKGLKKLKQAEFTSDINSETDDCEKLKKSRKDRAKKTISSDSEDTDDTRIQLPPYPKIPPLKKNTCDTKMSTYKSKQQFTKTTSIHKEKKLEDTNPSLIGLKKDMHNYLVTDSCGATFDKDEQIICDDKSVDKYYENKNDNSSSISDFRYVVRKLTDIGFRISSIEEQEKILNKKFDNMLRKLDKFFLHEEIIEKEIAEQCLMDNFPIDNIEDLEKLEKLVIDNTANRKELIKQLSRIGGNSIKGVTFNLLQRLMSDKLRQR